MKYIFLKARNIQPDDDLETAMAVENSTSEVSNRNFKAPPNPFPPQTSAVNLLASMIGGADFPSLGSTPTSGIGLPLLSPSPTLPNLLSTPSPTISNFPFVFQERQEATRLPVTENPLPPIVKQADTAPLQPRLPIKIKLKKVASSDKYVIETPKGIIKQEPTPLAETIGNEYSALLEAAEFKPESVDTSQYQHGGSVEQFIQTAVDASHQPMDFSTEIFSDNLVPDLLRASSSGNVPGTSGVSSVEGIFQTLPGGASGSPAVLDMDDPYGFDTGLGK